MFQFEVINEKNIIEDNEEVKVKKKSPFDYSNSIDNKENVRDELESYSSFMINKIYSQYRDTIYFANEMNKYNIDNIMHYDYYYHIIPKRKRFTKWGKCKYNETDIKLCMEYYNCSHKKANDIIDLIDINAIKNELNIGGLKK